MYQSGDIIRLGQGFTDENSIFGTIVVSFQGRAYELEQELKDMEDILDDIYQSSGIEGIYWGTVQTGTKVIKDRIVPGDKIYFFADDIMKEKQIPPASPIVLKKKQLPFT